MVMISISWLPRSNCDTVFCQPEAAFDDPGMFVGILEHSRGSVDDYAEPSRLLTGAKTSALGIPRQELIQRELGLGGLTASMVHDGTPKCLDSAHVMTADVVEKNTSERIGARP
jgi:hypothetical protein